MIKKSTLLFLLSFIVLVLLTSCGNKNETQGNETTKIENSAIKPIVNVYIENSGSMAGYVKGYSDFKDAVGNFLSDIQNSGVADSLNLFFINKKTEKNGTDVNVYLAKLTNSCNAATSDIAQIFQTVLSETNNEQISIFVTDGIFSPEKGKNATDYLKLQQKNIKEAVAKHLQQYPQTTISVYQLSSDFDGIYYNRNDAKSKINKLRPYYIWIIGNVANIDSLKTHIPNSKFKGGGVQHSYTLLPAMNSEIDHAILNAPKYGTFNRDKKLPKTAIYNIKKASSGKGQGQFMFTIGMDLSLFQILLGDEYLMNTDSYAQLINKMPNNDYLIEMEHNTVAATKHTHNMKLTTDKISVGDLEIVLKNNFPQWIENANDSIGLSAVSDKTFGIKYLVEGIYEAYNFSGNTIYTTMKFNLKK